MSEAATATPAISENSSGPTPVDTAQVAANLFPGPNGEATVAAAEGASTVAGIAGADSVAGADGTDTLAATAGVDSVSGADYEFAFPDTFTPADDLVAEARTVLAEAGVPKDKAQSVIDLYVKTQTAAAAAATAAFDTQQRENMTTINAMPEFQGATRETSLQQIGAVLDEFGPEAKAGILSNPAVGNDPSLVKFMLAVGKALAEGTPTHSGRPAPNGRDGKPLAGRSTGQILFGSDDPSENSINAR